ncbi:MAG: NAD(P)-dependent oxidoreductase [Bacteroidota bacterium]|nr:NAD(P)-dependent oxidoreductase [Bacteroidota bacterium]
MFLFNIGLLRETKIPTDKRVPFTPLQCKDIEKKYSQIKFKVQSSKIRTILDAEYKALGIKVVEQIDDCDVLMGIKEVHPAEIIEGKTYFIFSHTIKKQIGNQKLLQSFIDRKATLIDYECLKDQKGNRVVAFGYFAGIVGAYNTIRAYGLKYKKFELPHAYIIGEYDNLKKELLKVQLPPVSIVVTGGGRVAEGIIQILDFMKIKKVAVHEFLNNQATFPRYVQIHSEDYHKLRNPSEKFSKKLFYSNPELFESDFMKFGKKADILIAGAYWHPDAPVLFTKKDMKDSEFKIRIIGDITCDVNGSIPCTIKTSSIDNPYYDYNPKTDDEDIPFKNSNNITVMAIDNLPCELSRDASKDFGNQLIKNIIPQLISEKPSDMLKSATIVENGKLTQNFSYLNGYVNDGH